MKFERKVRGQPGAPDALLFLLVHLLILLQVCYALRIVSVEVPAAVANGSQLSLACNYELDQDQLYSVKWYKNYIEFYRFQPTAPLTSIQEDGDGSGSKQEFELEGINLSLAKSNASHVYLKQTNLASEGTYKCEVSADSPSFITVSQERQMKVYVLPKHKLSIAAATLDPALVTHSTHIQQPLGAFTSGQALALNHNELVNLTCSAGLSRPASKLSWLINDSQQFSPELFQVSQLPPITSSNSALTGTRSSLIFRLDPNLVAALEMARVGYQTGLRISCLWRLSVEFQSESSLELFESGDKIVASTARRRPNSVLRQFGLGEQQSPMALTRRSGQLVADSDSSGGVEQQKFLAQSSGRQALNYRWPRPVTNRPEILVNSSFESNWRSISTQQHTSTRYPVRADQQHKQQQQSEFGMTESSLKRRTHQQGVIKANTVWDPRQLKDQVEHIERILHRLKPNELQSPVIQIQSGSELGAEGRLISMIESQTYPTSSTRNSRRGNNNYVGATCSPRFSSMINLDDFPTITSKWVINDRDVNLSRINSFDGSNYFYRPSEDPTNNPPDQDTALSDSEALKIGDRWGRSSRQLETHGTISIELGSSLLETKEMQLKCKSSLEQPLIEYEVQLVIPIMKNEQVDIAQVQQTHSRQRGPIARNQNRTSSSPSQRIPAQNRAQSSSASELARSHSLKMISVALLWINMAFNLPSYNHKL